MNTKKIQKSKNQYDTTKIKIKYLAIWNILNSQHWKIPTNETLSPNEI